VSFPPAEKPQPHENKSLFSTSTADPYALRREDLAVAVVTVKSRLRVRYEIRCPECEVSLLSPPNRAGGLTHAELAIATGRCPTCGKETLSTA
jgi:hypothetical protein